jgi:hypothetical protein
VNPAAKLPVLVSLAKQLGNAQLKIKINVAFLLA